MSISKDFVNIYKSYLREVNHYKKTIKHVENMKRKIEKKQVMATEEEIKLLEKEELNEEDEFSCTKDKIYYFSNGDKYIGKVERNELHGNGYYIMYDNGNVILEYTGEFVNNLREGIGECKFANGNIYIGNFKDDLMNGIGQMIYSNGDEYIGQWEMVKKMDLEYLHGMIKPNITVNLKKEKWMEKVNVLIKMATCYMKVNGKII